MKIKPVILTTLLLLAFTTLIATSYSPAVAQVTSTPTPATNTPCNELQVIFVIDQSGSMSGFTTDQGRTVPATDPNGLRFIGPKAAADSLAGLRYQSYGDATMKMAMVYFGDNPRTAMPWEEITPDSDSDAQALRNRLAPYFAPTSGMGNTLPLRALQSTSSLFAQVNEPIDGCPVRAVFIITDGQPADGTTGFNPGSHFNEMENYVKRYMAPPDHQIYVIGVDLNGTYFQRARSNWERIAGDPTHVVEASTPLEIIGALNRFITPLTRRLTPEGEAPLFSCIDAGALSVPPYIREMRLQYVKPSAGDHLVIADSRGVQVSDTQANVRIEGYDELIETYIITNPEPGLWNILTNLPPDVRDACLVTFTAFKASERIVQPAAATSVTQYNRVPIEFQIVDGAGNPLPDYSDPSYNLSMDVKLATPDGGEEVLTLGANPGRVYRGEILALHPGPNQLTVRAISRNPDGSTFLLYADQPDGVKPITTINVDPVQLNIVEPPPLVHQQYKEFTTTFALGTSDAVTTTIVLPVRPLVTISHNGGAPQSINVENRNGLYIATARIEKAGEHVVSYTLEIDTPGGATVLGPVENRFSALEVRLLSARFESPEAMVVTDIFGPFGRKTGIELAVQLVDETNSPVGVGAVGLNDPNSVFKLTVRDEDNQDVTAGLALVQADGPGRFRLQPNALGVGTYSITLEPVSQPASGYDWDSANWTYNVSGRLNPGFYGVLGAAGLALALIAFASMRFVQVRRHPLTGSIIIYEQVDNPDGSKSFSVKDRKNLPKRNSVTLQPRISTGSGKNIRALKVSCSPQQAKDRQARVQIKRKGAPKSEKLLLPGQAQQIVPGLYIVKDRLPDTATTSSGGKLPNV